jgi:AAA family ATP:ADP antiporter
VRGSLNESAGGGPQRPDRGDAVVLGSELTRFERLLRLVTRVRPGEGRSVGLFSLQGFLLLFAFYVIRALREGFLLAEHDAASRSYAVAVAAVVLMLVIPLYSALRRRIDPERLVPAISVFLVANLAVFYLLWLREVDFGFVFFVWVGLFGLLVVSQFWAFAADTYNTLSGRRLFPVIMIGANLGALAGAEAAEIAVEMHGLHGLMLLGSVALLATVFLGSPARRATPPGSRARSGEEKPTGRLLGGFSVVFRDRYLLLIALLIVLLNWVNTTGEFILADLVQQHAVASLGGDADLAARGEFITGVYARYMFWYTLLGLGIQVFLVSRIFQRIGISGAVLVLPVIAMIGYGLIGFVPIFSLIFAVKVLENSVDYSLMSTTRQALFLPTSRAAKYEGKLAIDTFFWRLGDLIQAGVVFIGIERLGWGTRQFALLSCILALVWLLVAVQVARAYRRTMAENSTRTAPELAARIPDFVYRPGLPAEHALPREAFVDSDPGDILTLAAFVDGGQPLPPWLMFDPDELRFAAHPPPDYGEEHSVEVTATDVDGLHATGAFRFLPGELGP